MTSLVVEHVSKRFGSKLALDDVAVNFEAGKIHVLLGENGAGKSTLAAVLSGSSVPTSGRILVDGRPVDFSCPHDSAEFGIAMVHQRPLLAKELTVWENIILGAEPVVRPAILGVINKDAAIKKIELLQEEFPLETVLDPYNKASALSADNVFYTAFLAVLYRNPKFIILDEPCAPLTDLQRKELYSHLKKLARQGLGIIVITHNILEAMEYSDKVSVLRKGRVFFDGTVQENSFEEISENFSKYTDKGKVQERVVFGNNPLLSVLHLGARPVAGTALFDLSFSVCSGEIVLILGQREAGMETLENILTGMNSDKNQGEVVLGNFPPFCLERKALSVKKMREFGVGIVPFDRTFYGSNPALKVVQVAAVYEKPSRQKAVAQEIVSNADIQISLHESASNLSGGMLQRLILARELHYKPKLLILSEPLQGLDAESAMKLAAKLDCVAKEGTGILVLATEANTLETKATRIYELVAGRMQERNAR